MNDELKTAVKQIRNRQDTLRMEITKAIYEYNDNTKHAFVRSYGIQLVRRGIG